MVDKILKKINPEIKTTLEIKNFWKKNIEPKYKKTKVVSLKNGILFLDTRESHPIIKKKTEKNKKAIISKIIQTLKIKTTIKEIKNI